MRLTQDFRSQLYGPWETAQGFLVEQFDHLIAQIIASYGKEHTALDAHGDITALSIIISGLTVLGQGLTINSTAVITPPPLTGDTNDYNPAGLATATIIHQESTGAAVWNLTGLQAPADRAYRIVIFMPTGVNNLTLVDQSPLSVQPNRFSFVGVNYTFGPYPLALIYDTQYLTWRPLFRGD